MGALTHTLNLSLILSPCPRDAAAFQVMAIDGFHVTPKNVFALLKGDGKTCDQLPVLRRGKCVSAKICIKHKSVFYPSVCLSIYPFLYRDLHSSVDWSHMCHVWTPRADTPGHLISIKFRRRNILRAIEVVLTRVSVMDLAERRRYEAQLATEKRLAEEAYEAVRVKQVWECVCVYSREKEREIWRGRG